MKITALMKAHWWQGNGKTIPVTLISGEDKNGNVCIRTQDGKRYVAHIITLSFSEVNL